VTAEPTASPASPRHFWRVAPGTSQEVDSMLAAGTLRAPAELFAKLRPRHGVVLGAWDPALRLGRVGALGIVTAVDVAAASASVDWRRVDITLRPNPSGRTFWANHPFFRFADEVAVRYMLADLFAEHFPAFGQTALASASRGGELARCALPTSPVAGYVYVIRSPYGYKIGKTVNLKVRTRLFEVKLPFPVHVEHYAWFDDYTAAERGLHLRFQAKRLEGEWFALTADDLAEIRALGRPAPA
jgi:hypothetical protein